MFVLKLRLASVILSCLVEEMDMRGVLTDVKDDFSRADLGVEIASSKLKRLLMVLLRIGSKQRSIGRCYDA